MKEALVVLDVQQIYTDKNSELYCKDSNKTIANINKLIAESQNGRSIVLVRHVHKKDGSDIGHLFDFAGEMEDDFNFKEGSDEIQYDPNLSRPANAIEIKKTRYSAFANTELDAILKKQKVKKIVVCGFMTNFCCESTARDALDRDFYVDFVIDATGTPGTDEFDQKKVRDVVSEILGAGFARVFTTREILAQWKKG